MPTLKRLTHHSSARVRKKRILYIADRNVLIDQTMVNDFRPFGVHGTGLPSSRQLA